MGVAAHGCRPARRGQGLRRLPDDAAGQRRHRARPRQLAEPDQDPADGHRRQSQRTLVWDDLEPAAAALASTTAASTSHRRRERRRAAARGRQRLLPARRHAWLPPCPSARRCRAMVAEFAAAIREGRPPRTDGAAGLRVLSVLEAASDEPGADGLSRCRSTPAGARWLRHDDRSLRGRDGPGHRRRRHDRVDDRGPAPRRRGGPGRRAGQPGARPARPTSPTCA